MVDYIDLKCALCGHYTEHEILHEGNTSMKVRCFHCGRTWLKSKDISYGKKG